METKNIILEAGFKKLDHSNIHEQCENCGKENADFYIHKEMNGDGCCWCFECIINTHCDGEESEFRINKLVKLGHTEHCAARQEWGDGFCECHIDNKQK